MYKLPDDVMGALLRTCIAVTCFAAARIHGGLFYPVLPLGRTLRDCTLYNMHMRTFFPNYEYVSPSNP